MIKINIFTIVAQLRILRHDQELCRLAIQSIALRFALRQSVALKTLTLETWFLVLRRDRAVFD